MLEVIGGGGTPWVLLETVLVVHGVVEAELLSVVGGGGTELVEAVLVVHGVLVELELGGGGGTELLEVEVVHGVLVVVGGGGTSEVEVVHGVVVGAGVEVVLVTAQTVVEMGMISVEVEVIFWLLSQLGLPGGQWVKVW